MKRITYITADDIEFDEKPGDKIVFGRRVVGKNKIQLVQCVVESIDDTDGQDVEIVITDVKGETI